MIGLAEAALHLGIPYQNAHRLLLTGQLRGEKRGSRWYVQLIDVQRLVRAAKQQSAVLPIEGDQS